MVVAGRGSWGWGHQVAYLPGRAKTDTRDAFTITDATWSRPQTPRPVDVGDDSLADPEVLAEFDDDLVRHEALCDRVEVKGLRRWAVAAVR